MEFQQVMQQINKKQIDPIYTVVGSENYLKNQFMEGLFQQLGGIDVLDISRIDLQEVTMNDVLDEAEMFSFSLIIECSSCRMRPFKFAK